jgi:hypothetical protein
MKKSGKSKLVRYILHNYLFKVAEMYHVMTHEGILSELSLLSTVAVEATYFKPIFWAKFMRSILTLSPMVTLDLLQMLMVHSHLKLSQC